VTTETTHAHDPDTFEETTAHGIGAQTGPTGTTAATTQAGPAAGRWPFPPIVVLCGSMRFAPDMARENARLTASGHVVLAPAVDMRRPSPLSLDPVGAARMKARLDELHRAKIRLADEVVVICPGQYIGESTRSEIDYATTLGKPITYRPNRPEPAGRT